MRIRTAKDLGAAIRQARTRRGMSQATLAATLGISQPRISDIESGSTGVRLGVIFRILAALGLTIVLANEVHTSRTKSRAPKTDPELIDLDAIADTGLDPWQTKS